MNSEIVELYKNTKLASLNINDVDVMNAHGGSCELFKLIEVGTTYGEKYKNNIGVKVFRTKFNELQIDKEAYVKGDTMYVYEPIVRNSDAVCDVEYYFIDTEGFIVDIPEAKVKGLVGK